MVGLYIFINRVIDLMMAPFNGMHPLVPLGLWSVIVGVAAMIIYTYTSKQDGIKDAKERTKGHFFGVWLYIDDAAVIARAQAMIMWNALRYMGYALPPLAIMIVIFFPLFANFETRYAMAPVEIGSNVLVKVRLTGHSEGWEDKVSLDLPDGVIVKPLATKLARPTTLQRLIETRTCSEMGHRLIMQLQREDGQNPNPASTRLASITPGEYVAKYRDRMPSKITLKAYTDRFGGLRGLNDGDANAKGIYKIRSRAEHHIYEHSRVRDFVASINRARRADTARSLKAAGDLMYASHWSHSQRCGIGGVESDRLATAIRGHGEQAGLFGEIGRASCRERV